MLDKTKHRLKLSVVIPFHSRDLHLAVDLLTWISQLGRQDYHLYLVCPFISMAVNRQMQGLGMSAFSSVEFIIPSSINRAAEVWPIGANKMFLETIKNIRTQFLWLEPDSVPLKPDWLDKINEEYWSSGKPFMGSINRDAAHPMGHLSGVAVYPVDALRYWEDFLPSEKPFDMVNQFEVLKNTHHTDLIYNFWGQAGLPPKFKEYLEKGDPENTLTPQSIPKKAVLFHRSKYGDLIKILRKDHQ